MNIARLIFSEIRRAPLHVKLLTVLGLVYLASPIDLIPDFLPVIGQLDDVLIAGAILRLLTKHSTDAARSELKGALPIKLRTLLFPDTRERADQDPGQLPTKNSK